MKIAQRIKYTSGAFVFAFATITLSFANVQFASALSKSWTGAGDGATFSDTANWSTGTIPADGDVLTFTVTDLAEQTVLDNDISGLDLDGIIFAGNANTYYSYTLQGNPITLNGNVQNTTTGVNSDYSLPVIQNNLVLGSDVSVNKVNIGTTGTTVNVQSNSLTFSGSASCGVWFRSNLSGSGALNLTGSNVNVQGANTSYTGPISVTGSAAIAPAAFGTSAAGTTVSGSGVLSVINQSNATVSEPFTFGGSGSFASAQNYFGCSGGAGSAVSLTLTGGVTLTSNFLYKGENNLIVNTPYTPNGHTFTVAGGVSGTLTTPEGEVTAPEETIQLDGDSSTFVNIGNKQTGVLNGTRDNIGVQAGGLLKGTGTTNSLYVSEGGKVNPGNSPGTLTVLDSFSLSGTYEAELLNSTSYDKLAVGENYTGGSNAVYLNSGATLSIVLYDGWSVKQGDKFTLVDNLSTTPVENTFAGLAEGAQLSIEGVTFSISYVGGDGNDIVLTALNTGTDPAAPNTGVLQVARKNPLVVVGLAIATAAVLIAIAVRRRQTN